jgi:hypothetical protein
MEMITLKIKPEMLRGTDGSYTIHDGENKGGAIISDMDPFEAMRKFKEATNLSCAVKTLLEFKNGVYYVAEFD